MLTRLQATSLQTCGYTCPQKTIGTGGRGGGQGRDERDKRGGLAVSTATQIWQRELEQTTDADAAVDDAGTLGRGVHATSLLPTPSHRGPSMCVLVVGMWCGCDRVNERACANKNV